MMLSTSTTSSRPSSSNDYVESSNTDSTHSFSRFLDLITPAEFSKLLKTRVRHLLSTWPPQSANIQNSSATTSSSHTEHPVFPTLESIEAFATFFRSQDSPLPSPTDPSPSGSSATSLSTLRQHLLALQTLLSFLSGRELKDIVRARLAECGKDKSVAVQGLMEVMRNPLEGGAESAQIREHSPIPAVVEEGIPRVGRGGNEELDTSADVTSNVPPSPPIATFDDGKPLKKWQDISETSGNPLLNQSAASTNSSAPEWSSGVTDGEMGGSSDEQAPLTPDPILKPEGGPSKPLFGHSPGQSPYSMNLDRGETVRAIHNPGGAIKSPDKNTRIASGDGDFDKLISKQHKVGSPPKSGLKGVSLVHSDAGNQRFSVDSTRRYSASKAEEQDSELVTSRETQHVGDASSTLSRNYMVSGAGVEVNQAFKTLGGDMIDQPQHHFNSRANDDTDDLEFSTPSFTPVYSPASPLSDRPSRSCSRSRSRSRSFLRSISDRGSPPGPMLRTAVDWASGISSTADGGSDGTRAFGHSAIFNPQEETESLTPDVFAPKSFKRSTSAGWDGGDAPTSDTENTVGRVAKRRKLFIRLPARPRSKLNGPGIASESSIAPSSVSTRATSVHGVGKKRSSKLTAVGETLSGGATSGGRGGPSRSETAPDAPKLARVSESSSNVTPTSGSTSTIAAPHAQQSFPHLSGSRPQSGSPSTGSRAPYTTYPAQPYPGPWFGAMFYVPFRGHPHPHAAMPHPPKMPAGPSRNPSDTTASGRTEVEEQAASAPAPAAASSSVTLPTARRRVPKRESDYVERASPPPPVLDPDVTYTDDVGVKESSTVKRRCYNCRGIQAPSWRKSKLTFGKILCNKCGIYESTHMMARPLKTRPRRAQLTEGEDSPPKKHKVIKKFPSVPML